MKIGINVEQAAEIRSQKGLIPTNLQSVRVDRKLTQNQLAKLSGVSIRTIQHFESRNRDIDGAHLDILLDLCMALNCGLCDILESKDLINKVKQVVYYL